MGFNKLTLKSKLIFALSIIASFTVLTSSTAIFLFSEVKHGINELTHRDIISLQHTFKISNSLKEIKTTLESIRTDYRIRENNNNIIKLKNNWLVLDKQFKNLKNTNSNITLDDLHHTNEITQLIEQLPNLSQVLFDLMEARLTSAYIHKDVITQQSLLHSQLSSEIRIVYKEQIHEANNNKNEYLSIMNKLIDFHDTSTELSSILLSAFDENNIAKLNSMGRHSLTLHNTLSKNSHIFPPNTLIITKSWLQQIRKLLVGDTSIFTIRRTEQRLTNIIDTLLNQHDLLANRIEQESEFIAQLLYEKVNTSAVNITHKLAFFSNLLIAITIICLILVFLIIWLYIGRKIFRPINKIKNAMINISNGNTETELPIIEDNEVGDMVLALSKLKEHVSNVTNMAQYDGLTNLLNRREFDTTLKKEFRRCKREQTSMSLLLCDIDFFKYYNDNYGHIEGDNCLVSCTKEMSALFTRVTDSCFRYGGEEFAVIMVGVEPSAANEMAEKLRSKIEALGIEHNHSRCAKVVTISVGMIHCEPHRLSSSQELLTRADTQLYLAKDNGRNRVEMAIT